MPDEQDRAEALDDDKLGGEYPPEQPLGATEDQDDAVPESFAEREAHTLPEVEEELALGDDRIDPDDDPVSPEDEVTGTPEAAEEAALRIRDSGRA